MVRLRYRVAQSDLFFAEEAAVFWCCVGNLTITFDRFATESKAG
jgi:hypothetical protein